MRILGWLLLLGGLLLCVSVVWAAPGFFCMGLGLIFLQIAEQNRRRAKSAASPYDQSGPRAERARIPEAALAVIPPETDEDAEAGRDNLTGPYSYDRREWRALLRSDADILRLAKILESYGQKYVDEFAAAYLAVNDKDYLPMILQKIIASARRDGGQNIAGDFPDENTNPDPVANRKAPAADAESNPVAVTSPEPPEAADAAVGEKKGEVDAVDAGNLTEILARLSQELIPKSK